MERLDVTQEVRQIGKGGFRAGLSMRSSAQADLYADRFSKAISMYLEPPAGTVGLLFPRSVNGKFLASGAITSNDELVFMPAGSGTDIVIPDLAGSDAITIPATRFTAMAEALCPSTQWPENMCVLKGHATQQHALRQTVLELLNHPWEPDEEELSNLLAASIAWMGQASNSNRSERLTVNCARVRIAKRAQEFIEAHYHEVIRIDDLCRTTDVGARTLQRCFRNILISPLQTTSKAYG